MADVVKDKAPTPPEVKDTPPSREQLESAGVVDPTAPYGRLPDGRERGSGGGPKEAPWNTWAKKIFTPADPLPEPTSPNPDLVLPMNLPSARTQGLLKNEWPTIRSAELRDGVIRPTGTVENLEALNRLKEHLIQEPGVESIDTSGIVVSSDDLAKQRDKASMNAMRMASAFGESSF